MCPKEILTANSHLVSNLGLQAAFIPHETRPRLVGSSYDHWETLQICNISTSHVKVLLFHGVPRSYDGHLTPITHQSSMVGVRIFSSGNSCLHSCWPGLWCGKTIWQGSWWSSAKSRCCNEISVDPVRLICSFVWRNGRNLWEQIRPASSCITLKNQLKEWREKVKAGTSLASKYNLSTSDVFFFLSLPERQQHISAFGKKGNLPKLSELLKKPEHTDTLNLITLT